jgi:ferredoxin
VRVEVDVARCQGHGRCYDLMPDVFDCDARGRVSLLVTGDLPEDLVRDTRIAVLNCPEAALRLVD